jgi:hypothetical protein
LREKFKMQDYVAPRLNSAVLHEDPLIARRSLRTPSDNGAINGILRHQPIGQIRGLGAWGGLTGTSSTMTGAYISVVRRFRKTSGKAGHHSETKTNQVDRVPDPA